MAAVRAAWSWSSGEERVAAAAESSAASGLSRLGSPVLFCWLDLRTGSLLREGFNMPLFERKHMEKRIFRVSQAHKLKVYSCALDSNDYSPLPQNYMSGTKGRPRYRIKLFDLRICFFITILLLTLLAKETKEFLEATCEALLLMPDFMIVFMVSEMYVLGHNATVSQNVVVHSIAGDLDYRIILMGRDVIHPVQRVISACDLGKDLGALCLLTMFVPRLGALCEQVKELNFQGYENPQFDLDGKARAVVGQSGLIAIYNTLFSQVHYTESKLKDYIDPDYDTLKVRLANSDLHANCHIMLGIDKRVTITTNWSELRRLAKIH
uniref:Delta-1-pyrroline-5-carboxylate synthetase n=1 Tax=Aegilops tauschii TaxID=37682 RepID=R7WD43_AEGTA